MFAFGLNRFVDDFARRSGSVDNFVLLLFLNSFFVDGHRNQGLQLAATAWPAEIPPSLGGIC